MASPTASTFQKIIGTPREVLYFIGDNLVGPYPPIRLYSFCIVDRPKQRVQTSTTNLPERQIPYTRPNRKGQRVLS